VSLSAVSFTVFSKRIFLNRKIFSLDDWLKRRARVNHINGASRNFVVVDANQCVIGYYALAAGAVTHQDALSAVRETDQIPYLSWCLGGSPLIDVLKGLSLGAGLLQDAVVRVRAVSENVGVRALLFHALNERAKKFYQKYGFQESPMHPMTLAAECAELPASIIPMTLSHFKILKCRDRRVSKDADKL